MDAFLKRGPAGTDDILEISTSQPDIVVVEDQQRKKARTVAEWASGFGGR
jgi:hypothetical protein